jgi:thiamine biosynthesis lipoprotein
MCVVFVMVGVGATTGCSHRADEPAAAAPRSRYDCLIIRNLTGKDDVVSTRGFPECFTPEALEAEPVGVPPAANIEAPLLGTTVRVAVYELDAKRADAAARGALARIDELTMKLNIFDPKSEVSRINREAWRAAAPIDSDVERLLSASFEVSRLSSGAFDVTVGPLTSLWRKYRAEGKVPPDDEAKRARELVGWEKVTVTRSTGPSTGSGPISSGPSGSGPSGSGAMGEGSVRFAREGMSIDLGGIAKGYAAEEAAKMLRWSGVRSAIVACSGDIRVIGSRPGGKSFRIGIDDPRPDAPAPQRFVFFLSDAAVSTSGNYRQFTIIGGRRYSHIINPKTGESIEALPSVTVVGLNGTMCDALATAISVLGEEEGLKLIEAVNDGVGTGK